jgi:pimeloyl-ACP methyl ester carboxylesterase
MFPDGIKHMVLSDTGPEVVLGGARQVMERASTIANVRGHRSRAEVLEHVRLLFPDWRDEYRQLHASEGYRWNWAQKLVSKSDPELLWITGSVSRRQIPDMWTWYSSVKARTLIMWGRRSHLMDRELVDRMVAELSTSEAMEFDTGHSIPYEDPEGFTARLRFFLASD